MKPQRRDHKTLRLCKQVERTLNYVLADGSEPLLSTLMVTSVEPAPDASQLAVTVQTDAPEGQFDPHHVMQVLLGELPRLRGEVAASIHRRRTPQLVFRVIGRPDS